MTALADLDDLLVCVPLIMIGIGIVLVLVVSLIADPAKPSSSDDPYFFPIAESPTVPPEAIGNYRRHVTGTDFRPGVAE